jgi:hypothetical protein
VIHHSPLAALEVSIRNGEWTIGGGNHLRRLGYLRDFTDGQSIAGLALVCRRHGITERPEHQLMER